VFISYSGKDIKLVEKLVRIPGQEKITVLWTTQEKKQLKNSKAILIRSENSQ
jgi:hypothetical protein